MTGSTRSWFFAYAGLPRLRSETMRDAAATMTKRGVSARTWEDLGVQGTLLVETITAAIKESDAVLAEVSDLNPNVLFEAGYGLAQNKDLWLAVDVTDTEAERNWKELGILATVGRVNYSGDIDGLVGQCMGINRELAAPSLLEILLTGGRSREPEAVFAPSIPTKFQAATSLESMLERQSHLTILGAGDDLGMAPLDFYVKEIYRSSAAIFHLLGPRRIRAKEHNARASFLAGIAAGFSLPVLMLVEEGFQSPLDYKDLLFSYDSTAALVDYVKRWLDSLPKSTDSRRRLGRLALDIELPLRSFGQYVAEYERDELSEYFVDTSEFTSILQGSAKVFVGRKGTGKTATMSQAVVELRRDRRNLVVPVKPSAYELGGLVAVVAGLDTDLHSEYLMLSLWTYLLYTEIAVRAVKHAGERPAGAGPSGSIPELQAELDGLNVRVDGDLSTRLEEAVQRLRVEARREGEAPQAFISRSLRVHKLGRLRDLILVAIKDFDRVAILIDNLDKTWERGADYRLMSRFILSLLAAIGRVEKDFSKPGGRAQPVNVTLTVFLRTDIYDAIARYAREPDKVGVLTVRWQDSELLVRVLEERYAANRAKRSRSESPDMWAEVFDSEVRGVPTRDYFLWRTLPRPRDFIYFANAALTTAINRKHGRITSADVIFAEKLYSRFAIEALLVESDAEEFDLEEALYEFAGLPSTFAEAELFEVLGDVETAIPIRDWLIRTSFLGLEVRPGEFVHVEGETDARRQLKVATRFAKRAGSPARFRVHPAFRAFLEVRDDDLHSHDVRDATLEEQEPID